MTRCLSGIFLFLTSLLLYAADEPSPVDTTVSAADEFRVFIFAVIFFGLILGYVAYVYWSRKKDKDDKKEQKK